MKAQERPERKRVYKPYFVCLPEKQQDWTKQELYSTQKTRAARKPQGSPHESPRLSLFLAWMLPPCLVPVALRWPGKLPIEGSCNARARDSAMRCEPSLGRRVAKRPGQSYAVTDVSDCIVARKKLFHSQPRTAHGKRYL